jgi:hypothetical protein
MNRTETFKAMSSKNRILRLIEIGAKEVHGTITPDDIADREAIQAIRFKNGEMEAVVKEWERDPDYHGPETAKVAAEFREEQARAKTREAMKPKIVVIGTDTDEAIKKSLRAIRAVTADFIDDKIVVSPFMEKGKAFVFPAEDMDLKFMPYGIPDLPKVTDIKMPSMDGLMGFVSRWCGPFVSDPRNSGIIDMLLDESAYCPPEPPKRKLAMYDGGKNRRYTNIRRLNHFRKYLRDPEWNGERSDAVSYRIVQKAMAVVRALPEDCQPYVFPTAWGTVQFEYGSLKKRESRLVIEIAYCKSLMRWDTKIAGEDGSNRGTEAFKTNTANIVRRIRDWHDAMRAPQYVMTATTPITSEPNMNGDVFVGEIR